MNAFSLVLLLPVVCSTRATVPEDPLALVQYHLTARPWTPLNIPRDALLDAVDGLCHFAAGCQDESGAVIDPFLEREHQYSTPYFAFAVGVLLHEGRGGDLLGAGMRAMDHSTACFAAGRRAIPDDHGEFFLVPLADALALYADCAPDDALARWRERLRKPLGDVLQAGGSKINNWRTYAMRGTWARHGVGLDEHAAAVSFVEDGWRNRGQRERIAGDAWNLYQDWSSDPQSHAVEAVGRVNLLALVAEGYDGPSAAAMKQAVERGTAATLLLQDPTGQCPPNGRTDNHVFNDVLYQLAFEVMAEQWSARGDVHLAGQYRRAALLSFDSIQRWRRTDGRWAGSYFVTKNRFDPAERVGYQPASNYGNYNGTVMAHLAQACLVRKSPVQERPAPCEIGGYVAVMDGSFDSAVVNAGGMHFLVNLRGDSVPKYRKYWTPLGVVRFSRVGWDSRLGPSDGVYDAETKSGITFGPAWRRGRRWTRIADKAEHYRATLLVDFTHPLLMCGSILYHDVTGAGGPAFRHDFTATPDGVLFTLRPLQRGMCGVTIPLLEDDGESLRTARGERSVGTSYSEDGDSQHFIAVSAGAVIEDGGDRLQSAYGWLKPYRAANENGPVSIFVYPQGQGDPRAEAVLDSFRVEENGFRSVLGRVDGTLYVGRYAAGGWGQAVDIDGDGKNDLALSEPCGFLAQLEAGAVVSIEADRAVTVSVEGQSWALKPHLPVEMR